MAKNLKSIYSLGGLLIKKKSLHVIQAINILRVFSSLRFFKVDYYPFDYGKFVKFYNELVVFAMYHNYLKFFKGVYSYLLNILKNNVFFKKNLNSEMKFILKWYKKSIFKYIRRKYLNKYKTLLYHKFKFIRLRKIYYLHKVKFGNKVKKSKSQLLKENKKMEFFSNLVNKKKNLLVIHHYLSYRFKKSLKKKFLYLRKQKQNTKDFIRYKFSDEIVYKKIKKKKKLLYTKLRLNFKGKNFAEKNESAQDFFQTLYKDKTEKKIKRFLRKRRKYFRRKYMLIKKYKRLIFRRKKRTGILHFRIYYSNYYVTLTDLSHNVIFSCSAGSVSDTNNKKTKMSNVVSMPIFFRILFFLRAFKIRNLKFVFRNKIDKMVFNAITFFKKKGYRIKSFSFVQKAPHHLGQRKQKPRRI